jgi:ECF sigma factor
MTSCAVSPQAICADKGSGTLQPTALVHEVYLQLMDQHHIEFHNRSHFFGAAGQIIRRILVDRAREKAQPNGAAAQYE